MRRTIVVLVAFGSLLSSLLSAQKFQPKSIQFKGIEGYSDAELLAAADLKPGQTLTAAEMNQHSQRLMDTGLFEGITYKFDGQDLIFQITPAAQLFPLRLENLPVGSAADIDAKLHQRLPLYHGKVPTEGGILTDICAALKEELKTRGIEASVEAAAYNDHDLHKVTAVSFTITSPSVVIGEIHSEGALDPEALSALAKATGMPYDRDGSARAIEKYAGDAYRDKGYLEAEAHATQQDNPARTTDAIRIPFQVSVTPRQLYKIASIQLAPGMVVSQADFDKQSQVHPGDLADGVHVRQNWEYIARQYHNHGYLRAKINPTQILDRAQSTVRYTVDAEPGPLYTMGTLTIENVSDDLRTMMLAAWKMPQGAAFNEGAVLGYFATHDVNPKLERIFAAVKIKYVLHPNDDTKTVDVTLRLERRPPA